MSKKFLQFCSDGYFEFRTAIFCTKRKDAADRILPFGYARQNSTNDESLLESSSALVLEREAKLTMESECLCNIIHEKFQSMRRSDSGEGELK